jgi:hypothetical protein
MNKNLKIRRKSQRQEKRTAKDFGGRTVIGSGCIDGMKGDVRTGVRTTSFNEKDFLIENKYTDADFYSLKLSTWKKVEKEALKDNLRTPLMQIDVLDMQLVIIKDTDMLAFCEDFKISHHTKFKGKSARLTYNVYSKHLQIYPFCMELSFEQDSIKLLVFERKDFLNLID